MVCFDDFFVKLKQTGNIVNWNGNFVETRSLEQLEPAFFVRCTLCEIVYKTINRYLLFLKEKYSFLFKFLVHKIEKGRIFYKQ